MTARLAGGRGTMTREERQGGDGDDDGEDVVGMEHRNRRR